MYTEKAKHKTRTVNQITRGYPLSGTIKTKYVRLSPFRLSSFMHILTLYITATVFLVIYNIRIG